ncbi:cleavage and polyadenylation specificity factor subunit 6-like [Chenopodium quinoa]|uniref:cleavage and polyadenylation specificity factor subunit 6-like n=1 Tax=Chenopodium quinoa TaxID=63459 RepID=UPI000B7813FB|nr:cleavage and polyadenylation specificity factor subunit 6-like [Chenopodium quinoa]
MDPAAEEQIDYGDEEYGGAQKLQYQGSGAIPALADEEMIGEDDDYEDLYDGVNVGEGFLQFHRSEAQGPPNNNVGNGGIQTQTFNTPQPRQEAGVSHNLGNSGVASDGRLQNASLGVKELEMGSSNHISGPLGPEKRIHDTASGNMEFQGSAPIAQNTTGSVPDISKANNHVSGGPSASQGIVYNQMSANANMNMDHMMVNDNIIRPQMDNGPTMLFVGELHWWTTDAELESVLSHYGKVKDVKFFDERASGKSKGYCQVEFYDASAAAACKEGMNGHNFNGRACVVAFASPQTLKQMGAAYASKNPQQPQSQPQGRRNVTEGAGRGGGMNLSAGEGGRGFGRGGWGRGGQGASARGPGGSGPRGRGPMGPKNGLGNVGGMGGAAMGNFGQGLGNPGFGGPGGGMMHPQAMMGPGFDPSYMGRGAGYGGFSGPAFPGMMPPFPSVNPMGMSGVAPHVNPAFFGRGMTPNGMGMMGSTGMEGHPGGMWSDPGMGGWAGEEHGQKTRESSYGGDDGASDYRYGEENPEKSSRTNAAPREKERASERDWSGNSERRYRDEREQDYDRSDRERRHREDKDGYRDHRRKERDSGYEDDWDRGQSSSRSRSRSRAIPEDGHRSRSRDVDYGKRRRAPSE